MRILPLLTLLLLAACAAPCSSEGLRKTAEARINANLSPGLDPAYEWQADSAVGGNITLVRGEVTLNTLAGPRQQYRTICRVWCDGAEPEATMVYVKNLMDREFNENGHDTLLTNGAKRMQQTVDSLKAAMDASQASYDSTLAASQHFLDSLEAAK